jgi:hypothetical protein
VFFREQTPEALIAAIHAFERHRHAFSASACRANAERFSVQRFVAEMGSFVESAWRERQKHVAVPTSDIAQEVTRAASCSA